MILQDEALLKRIEHCNWVLFVLLTSGCFAFLSPQFALGVFAGGLLAIANFFLMKRNLSKALDTRKGGGSRFLYLLKYCLRFAALGSIIALLLIKGWVSPFGMVLGLSIIVIGIVLVGLNEARKLLIKGVV